MTKSVCYRPWSDSLGRSTYTGCRGEVILAWERDAFFVETWPEKTCLGPKEQLGELLSHNVSPTAALTLWLDWVCFLLTVVSRQNSAQKKALWVDPDHCSHSLRREYKWWRFLSLLGMTSRVPPRESPASQPHTHTCEDPPGPPGSPNISVSSRPRGNCSKGSTKGEGWREFKEKENKKDAVMDAANYHEFYHYQSFTESYLYGC